MVGYSLTYSLVDAEVTEKSLQFIAYHAYKYLILTNNLSNLALKTNSKIFTLIVRGATWFSYFPFEVLILVDGNDGPVGIPT